MALQKGAFDHEAYNEQYGPALSQIAGFNQVSDQGGVDATDPDTGQSTLGGYDPDQERDVQMRNASDKNVAPLPGPNQMFRNAPTQKGANLGGGANSPTSPQSSRAFIDPVGPEASAPVYHGVSQLSDAQARAHANDIDKTVGKGKDDHGVPDLNTLWQHTYEDQIASHAKRLQLDGDAAQKAQNPTWRDKLAMMMDAANRSSIAMAQNPQLSKGAAWAIGTRGALDGWMAHAQGAHDAYSQEQSAFEEQARADADKAVKRGSDQFGLQAKADNLIELQKREAETERHNRATEANAEDKNTTESTKASREASKGDLVTLDADATVDGKPLPKGSIVRVGPDGKPHATGVSGTKTGTKAPNAGEDEKATKDAQGALDKAEAMVEKEEAAKAKDPMNLGKPPMSAEEKAARAKEILRTTNPKAYKALYPDEKDEPMADKKPAGNPAVDNSPWRQRAKQ